jgi:hypothetical protein
LKEISEAYQAGGATEADLFDHLLGPPDGTSLSVPFADLHRLSEPEHTIEFERYPFLRDVVERCRQRILEVELGRGETLTAASRPALALSGAGGLDSLVRLLGALGQWPLYRGRDRSRLTRSAVFSHLIRVTFPGESDTPDAFAARIREARIEKARVRELADFAPQWAEHATYALHWPAP